MHRHGSPVILLAGWLLMVPPSKTSVVDGRVSVKVDKDAPIDQWSQDSAYDTAGACQEGFAGLENRVIPEALGPAYIAAKCVPAEAVYPPKRGTTAPPP